MGVAEDTGGEENDAGEGATDFGGDALRGGVVGRVRGGGGWGASKDGDSE